jgi:hypothetical protein
VDEHAEAGFAPPLHALFVAGGEIVFPLVNVGLRARRSIGEDGGSKQEKTNRNTNP